MNENKNMFEILYTKYINYRMPIGLVYNKN